MKANVTTAELVVLGIALIVGGVLVAWLREGYYLGRIQSAAIGFCVGSGSVGVLYVAQWALKKRGGQK